MAYNPYKDVSEIINQKNAYNSAKIGGGNYAASQTAAQAYYQKLRDNGETALADELSKADATTAQTILKRYKPDDVANTTGSIISQVPPNLTNPATVNNSAGAINNAGSIADMLSKFSAPSPVQNQSNTQGMANLQALLDLTKGNNANINTQGNDLWAQMSKFGVDQTGRYNDLYGYIKNTDYMSTPEGQSIMNLYKERGGLAAGDATAQAAGANSGNIDSYSAANANRQNLSYLNAGTGAVLNQKNSNVGNMLATLQSLGVDVGDLQNRQINKIQGDQSYNANLAGQYTTGQNNVANQLQAQQNAQNGVIQKGLEYLGGIYTNDAATNQQSNVTAGNVVNGAIGAAAGVDTNKTNERISEGTNKAAIDQTTINADTQKIITSMNNKSAEEQLRISGEYANQLQDRVNQGLMSQSQANIEIQKIASASGITEAQISAAASNYASDNTVKAKGTTGTAQPDVTVYTIGDAVDARVNQLLKQYPGRSEKWAAGQAWAELEADYADDKNVLDLIKVAKAAYEGDSKTSGTGYTVN